MAGFDPMESIAQGADFAQGMMQRARQTRAYNALADQYGPTVGDPQLTAQVQSNATNAQLDPLKVQQAILQVDEAKREQMQAATLKAALTLKTAVGAGLPMDAAYDTIVAPNAEVLGMTPEQSAAMRDHLMRSPQSLDAIVNGLAGPAKPAGQPLMVRGPDGNVGYVQQDERGGSHPVDLGGGSAVSPITGQGIPEQLPDGSWGLVMHDKMGNTTVTRLDGTPVSGINAQTGQFNAGVRANNSKFGAPGGAATPGAVGGVPTSVDGAVGPGQVTPQFFKTFAKPGESIANPTDNLNIANRGIDYYMQQYRDPARAAVAYFSGPSNVAPAGSKTPWLRNAQDGNGTSVSTYTRQVLGRMSTGLSVNQAIIAQESGRNATPSGAPAKASGPLFDQLPPAGKQQAIAQATGIVNSGDQLRLIDGQIENVKKMVGPFSVGLGELTNLVPGTHGADMHAALDTLKSQGLTTWIQSLKNAGGSTGIGRILQSEANAAMSSYGALDQRQSEQQFRYHLGLFQQRVHQLQTTAEKAFKQQWGVDPQTAAGGPPQQAAAASTDGWSVVAVR